MQGCPEEKPDAEHRLQRRVVRTQRPNQCEKHVLKKESNENTFLKHQGLPRPHFVFFICSFFVHRLQFLVHKLNGDRKQKGREEYDTNIWGNPTPRLNRVAWTKKSQISPRDLNPACSDSKPIDYYLHHNSLCWLSRMYFSLTLLQGLIRRGSVFLTFASLSTTLKNQQKNLMSVEIDSSNLI